MKWINFGERTYLRTKIYLKTHLLTLPMKFLFTKKVMKIEVLMRFNKPPTLTEFTQKYKDQHEFFIQDLLNSPRGQSPKRIHSVHLIIKSYEKGKTQIGCAFKSAAKSHSHRPKRPALIYKNLTAQKVLKSGIDYKSFYGLKLSFKRKKKGEDEPKKDTSKIRKNMRDIKSSEKFRMMKLMNIAKCVKKIKAKTSRVNRKKEDLYEEKMFILRTTKSRNVKLKIEKLNFFYEELQKLKRRAFWVNWVKFITCMRLFVEMRGVVDDYLYSMKKQIKVRNMASILLKFFVPLKREAKSRKEGCWTDTKK